MQEESMNPATLAESAERMKSMTPEVSLVVSLCVDLLLLFSFVVID
jgi:hypothetical protein